MSDDSMTGLPAASRACNKCAQVMRLSYREPLDSGGELRVYECHDCRTTMTVVAPSDD